MINNFNPSVSEGRYGMVRYRYLLGLHFSDPDPTVQEMLDPDPIPDPT